MMSYQMQTSVRSRKIARFIAKAHRTIQLAFSTSGLSQRALAEKIGIDRAAVNRRLIGKDNLTLKTVAELAWALDQDIIFDFVPVNQEEREVNRFSVVKPLSVFVSDERKISRGNVTFFDESAVESSGMEMVG